MNNKLTIITSLLILTIIIVGAVVILPKFIKPELKPPSLAENQKLVLNTTLEFARAVQARDLSLFRRNTSRKFQEKFSQKQFDQAFGGYIQQNINLLPVAKQVPIFKPAPFVTKDGILVLKGYFPTQPSEVHFNYSYAKKNNDWKLVGITLQVKPAG